MGCVEGGVEEGVRLQVEGRWLVRFETGEGGGDLRWVGGGLGVR